ncbi:hypothetical protein [Spiroplasma apis]|uniref:Transmembrane protein n=1 Tax=Spiroplasma apis B31 TaxID=1276258 RepID=V5RHX0_SPIAP|nr:hypothetical protein [Spiroplasma apis]AHB36139.1 hypothetical protein SAPIS_v1c02930 [Spiroplasma apis B31]
MKKSWIAMCASFGVLTIISILFFALKDSSIFLYDYLKGSKFPSNQMQIWAILVMAVSILGLIVSGVILFLNFKDNDSLNKYANYAHIFVAVLVLFSAIMILVSGITVKPVSNMSTAIFALVVVFSAAVVGTTAWVAKDEFTA